MEIFSENPGVYMTEDQISNLIGNKDVRKSLENLAKIGKIKRIETTKKSGKKVYYGIDQ